MKFHLEVDTEVDDPNLVGEALRQRFWDRAKGFGCYENFEWASGIDPLPDVNLGWVEQEWACEYTWHRAYSSDLDVMCNYYWDGDGYLEFVFPDGTALVNGDCKKDHGWDIAVESQFEADLERSIQ